MGQLVGMGLSIDFLCLPPSSRSISIYSFQQTDQDKLGHLYKSEFSATHPRWREEMEHLGQEKAELEALGRVTRSRLTDYVIKAILQQDFI